MKNMDKHAVATAARESVLVVPAAEVVPEAMPFEGDWERNQQLLLPALNPDLQLVLQTMRAVIRSDGATIFGDYGREAERILPL